MSPDTLLFYLNTILVSEANLHPEQVSKQENIAEGAKLTEMKQILATVWAIGEFCWDRSLIDQLISAPVARFSRLDASDAIISRLCQTPLS